jgi:hypothetical protein
MKKIDGTYSINTQGVVMNIKTNKKLSHTISNGYVVVSLYRKSKKLHQLFAQCFIPNPNNYKYINHKDGNKLNNSLDNLEWCNYSMNLKHAWDNNLRVWNPKSARVSRFNDTEKTEIKSLKVTKTNKEIAQLYNCHPSIIQRITSNK